MLKNSFYSSLPEFYEASVADVPSSPTLVYYNEALSEELGIEHNLATQEKGFSLDNVLSGAILPRGAAPIAQAYAGHQFGQFNPQLGDGRALILGEISHGNSLIDICLKGSGRTPFSRGGDGKASLSSMMREVIFSEALRGLNVPSTGSLAVVATGDRVFRDDTLDGAILTRTASSHIRIGTFEYFAARRQNNLVKQLADYVIQRHYPDCRREENKYVALLQNIISKQASLVAKWMSVGFIHGVMNTDNVLVCGETIDFGPCAFMEIYSPDTVFSSIDHNGRYRYQNQPAIMQWNLARLAECLIPLLSDSQEEGLDIAKQLIDSFKALYDKNWLGLFRRKLGINIEDTATENALHDKFDIQLIEDFLQLLELYKADFTASFRALSRAISNDSCLSQALRDTAEVQDWQRRWRQRLDISEHTKAGLETRLDNSNPWIIPRNEVVEHILNEEIPRGDYGDLRRLLTALKQPFQEDTASSDLSSNSDSYFMKGFKTFCGT